MRYLSSSDVARALQEIDVVEVAIETAVAHAEERTILPQESYLGWVSPSGARARSLAMAGYIETDSVMVGVKLINASLGNYSRGLPRASGITVLFDQETARPRVLMDAAPVSAARTAAVSVAALRELPAVAIRHVAIIGCGTQGRAHFHLMVKHLGSLERVTFYDKREIVANAFGAEAGGDGESDLEIVQTQSPREAVSGADGVVTATTVEAGEGYLSAGWLEPNAIVAHVSLDDLVPDAVEQATTIIVDDWNLVKDDQRRLFGRMYREGLLLGPEDSPRAGVPQVAGELGHFLQHRKATLTGLTIVNPFGMAVHDVALGSRVEVIASLRQLGTWVDES